MKENTKSKLIILSELFFNILPILILIIVYLSQKKYFDIIFNSNWIFISIILFGQTIVKLASGVAKTDMKKNWQLVAFIIALIIVFGLVPSTVIYILIYLNLTNNFFSLIFQLIFITFSIFSYIWVGTVGQSLLDNSK